MTFGLLSAAQALAAAAAVAAAILVLFFLRLRHPLVVVPSLALWQRVLDERRRDSLLERLRRLVSLLLALTIGVLLVLAAAEPLPAGAGGTGGRIAIVLDNGPTMAALAPDGTTRLDAARAQARALVERAGGARFQVSDTLGLTRTPADLDRAGALAALAAIRAAAGRRRVPPAPPGHDLVVFTDGADLDAPASARLVRVGDAVPNVGITAFAVRATPARPLERTAVVSIVNFDEDAQAIDLTLGAPGQPRVRRTLTLPPGGALRDTLPLDELDPGIVELRIRSTRDRFPLDDVAYAWLPARRTRRVALVTPGSEALVDLLRADPAVSLEVLPPDRMEAADGADVIVLDRVRPDRPPARPALVFAPPAAASWLPVEGVTRTVPAPVVADPDHPVMTAVSFDDVHVERGVVLGSGGVEVLAAGEGRALVTAGRARERWLAVAFAPDEPGFASHASLPILVANALAWFAGEAEPVAARPGLIAVRGPAAIADAAGREVPAWTMLGTTWFAADRPGVYFARARDMRTPVVVGLADAAASAAVARPAPASSGEAPAPPARGRPWWETFALVALLLAAAEWWTWQRRVTV